MLVGFGDDIIEKLKSGEEALNSQRAKKVVTHELVQHKIMSQNYNEHQMH
jgi:hypothetical protein